MGRRLIISEEEKNQIAGMYSFLKESSEIEVNYHRYRQGGDPGIEDFLDEPLNKKLADELQHQLEDDKYAKGPESLRKTNLGKGTRNLFIYFNGVKMTPSQFIDQVEEDAQEGRCHKIRDYEYVNRMLNHTKITINTNEGPCETPVPETPTKPTTPKKTVKPCKHEMPREIDILGSGYESVRDFQKWCKSKDIYYSHYADGTKKECTEIDGIIGCCTSTCYSYIRRDKITSPSAGATIRSIDEKFVNEQPNSFMDTDPEIKTAVMKCAMQFFDKDDLTRIPNCLAAAMTFMSQNRIPDPFDPKDWSIMQKCASEIFALDKDYDDYLEFFNCIASKIKGTPISMN
jgi:hypothetical protein